MGSGINEEKINQLKIELLNYIEILNSISNQLENHLETIKRNLTGFGRNEIIKKFVSIKEQIPKISSNINFYIEDLGRAVSSYEKQDEEVASTLINNISKLDGRND